jgi:hypothetical protein
MMANLSNYLSRSQARRYNTPAQKNTIVHTTKAASLIENSLDHHLAYASTLRKW